MMQHDVDLVVLSRDDGELPAAVREGISRQRGVRICLHRVTGESRPDDACRWESIARARNEGRKRGNASWLMFVDDDVVLGSDTVLTLLTELLKRPNHGALAADYLDEARRSAGHVAMGATLFRRAALERIRFRWEHNRCECWCCCVDLRRQGIAIDYCLQAKARHAKMSPSRCHAAKAMKGIVLAAFDNRHFELFRDQFLKSLRSSGNDDRVVVVGYGLRSRQLRMLVRAKQVDVYDRPPSDRGDGAPRRRVRDFHDVLRNVDGATPVAYWDAGDVVFQSTLSALWREVTRHPDKLLAVREPLAHPENSIVAKWTLSIDNPFVRRQAFDLLSRHMFLNSGFAAGTAECMRAYLGQADRLLSAMKGTTDWGDQTALNLYCHSHPDAWREIEEGWNYCLCGRPRGEVFVTENGRITSAKGTRIHVVHGNARTLWRLRGYHRVTRMLHAVANVPSGELAKSRHLIN